MRKLKYGIPYYINGKINPEWMKKNYAYQRQWRAANRDKIRKYNAPYRKGGAKWEQRKKVARERRKILRKLHYEKYTAYWRQHRLRQKYGMTVEEYQKQIKSQGGGCAICGTPHKEEKGFRLQVDHDHKTGKRRGLLCSACNVVLGRAKDDPRVLRKAAKYVEYHLGR